MSVISVIQPHSKEYDELRELASMLVDKLEERYQLQPRWVSDTEIELKRAGVHGSLVLGEHQVEVTIKLGMLMRPMKSTIEQAVARALEDKLG